MRVLFVAWRDLENERAGGSEVLVDGLATELVARGHEVAVMSSRPVGARAYRVVANGGAYTQYLWAPFRYLRHFRGWDLAVDVTNGMAFLPPLWRRGPTICWVNHVHTEQWGQWFPGPVAAVGRFVESRVTPLVHRRSQYVAISPSTADALAASGVEPDRVTVVTSGTGPVDARHEDAPEPLFVEVGRIVAHKRVDLLLRAWERVRPRTGGRLVVVGDGPAMASLAGLAGEGVELEGFVTERRKQELLAQAWLLVHPAMHEGWGLVIQEAAAAGTPALAFDVPGVRDAVVDGMTGVLVRSEDELVERWSELAADHERRRAMGDAARRRAARLTWSGTADQFLVAAEAAVARHRGPAASLPPHRTVWCSDDGAAAQPDLSIVVPAFDEAERLPDALPQLVDRLRPAGTSTEVVLVDDGSGDATAAVAQSFLEALPRARILRLDQNRGKGAAVRVGVAAASGRVIAFMDADLATDLDDLPDLVAALDAAHLAIGSRSVPGAVTAGATLDRRTMGRAFNRLVRATTGVTMRDTQCGFKAYRAPVAKLLFGLSREEGFAFDVEALALADRLGFLTAEVPVHWHQVPGSHVKRLSDTVRMATGVLRVRARTRPDRVMASIRAWCRAGHATGHEVAACLRPLLSVTTPVLAGDRWALALFPFAEPSVVAGLTDELRVRLPGVEMHPSLLDTGRLLDPSDAALRRALVAV